MSINKAVVYLMLGSVVTMALGITLMRSRIGVRPGTRQTIGEQIYDVAQTQIAEQGLPSKAISRWFPYVASLLLFIFVVNLLGFIPLPLTGETWHGVPGLGHLRRHLVAVGHARPCAHDLRLHPLRGHSLERPGAATSRAGSPRPRRHCWP